MFSRRQEARQDAARNHLNSGNWRMVVEFTEVESGKRKDRPKLAEALTFPKIAEDIPTGSGRFVRGKYSAIGIGETFGVRASIAAGYIAKLDGTVDFGKAGGAIIQIEDSGGDAVDSARRRFGWPSRVLRSACLKCATIFWPKDVYLVSEAFRISKAGHYDLVDKNGAKLVVAGAAFGRTGPSSSDMLSVVEDLYVGVRRVKQLAPVLFEPSRRPRTVPEADGLLRLMEP